MASKKVVDAFRNLPVTSILRVFQVYEDEDREQFSNIFRAYAVSSEIQSNSFMFEYYNIDEGDFLDDISAKFYGTPTLWWIVAAFNDITNPFEELEVGEPLKILRPDYLYVVFDDLEEIGDL